MKYRLYGFAHKTVKKLLHRSVGRTSYRMVSINEKNVDASGKLIFENSVPYVNEINTAEQIVSRNQVFPVENIVPAGTCSDYTDSFAHKVKCRNILLGASDSDAEAKWLRFINDSIMPVGFRNAGLLYAGYIYEAQEWCLPSWIWTNAAVVRMYCSLGSIGEAKRIADLLLLQQQDCGGWIVRNDYDAEGAVPVLAPNDSAYIANNAFVELYLRTTDEKYLEVAIKCANWIMHSTRDDGMIYVGYDTKRRHWQKKHNIVDVGFTAGLFARLYEITEENKYLDFLKRFTTKYIELFYIKDKHGFATSIDEDDRQMGGMFGRGQAWALEGLIPANRVLDDSNVECIINDTVEMLLNKQNKAGGWAYNIARPLMGIDCKATSVIACSLMNWYFAGHKDERLKISAQKALSWCVAHTAKDGMHAGGIFSYTTEGAIVHHMYTNTAFVYGSAYAVELKHMLNDEEKT